MDNTYTTALLAVIARITLGDKVLTRFFGHDWHSAVDVSRIDMNSHRWCVVGQVAMWADPFIEDNYGNPYSKGIDTMFGEHASMFDRNEFGEGHGFMNESNTDAEWDMLNFLWRGFIESKRR